MEERKLQVQELEEILLESYGNSMINEGKVKAFMMPSLVGKNLR